MVLTLTIWYLLLFWKPTYYLGMVVMGAVGVAGTSTAYSVKLYDWFADLVNLVLPSNL